MLRKPIKKKPRYSKVVVALLLASVVVFTIAMTVIFCIKDAVPDTLIGAFFTFMAGEAGVLGLIKHAEKKYKPKDSEDFEEIGDE